MGSMSIPELVDIVSNRVEIEVSEKEYMELERIYPKYPELALGWIVLNRVNPKAVPCSSEVSSNE